MTEKLEFTLFSRSTCSLCEAMEAELAQFLGEYSIVVNRLYIDNDANFERLYGSKVPVLTLGEETICEYFLDTEALLAAIDAPKTRAGIRAGTQAETNKHN